ncbi:MAG TPA: cbb3-type cytochrome c oxidase subunit II [Leptospiraceae bacterium]|nr:cbb3-type cytochrome c oxidase subunit II [Leptospiraceae bacterium]HMW06195.1 cbb3-type cytochrome c oxidase subunit II [Leptospiraceae bacterium]HMX30677.1 cbb3-type cytochrome c oxidase subunit II [Leptospiraceae bacterium]HMY31856.1 cbb3-type cytochrome c oxidase subunit II [Leptospiraceae bacterium]HMZ64972.1 cbb3-type cytochrome c oxidase subunit II [Leptospiraceae bacterium]
MMQKIFDWFSDIADHWDLNGVKFAIYTTIAILIGGLFELIPPFFLTQTVVPIASVKPYSPIELAGRDIYIAEGCNSCHTQMIRPFKWEVDRFDPKKVYGKDGYSKGGEYVYDHPFLWGSKRTGPDLAHESQIQDSVDWHKRHLMNPRETSPGSTMPSYAWLFDAGATINPANIKSHMQGLSKVGVPYSQADYDLVESQLAGKTKGDALIAYLLKLGRDTANLQETAK